MDLNDVKKPEKLHSMQEAAAFMEISYITLYRLVKSGKIIPVNIASPESKKPIYAFTAEAIQSYYDSLPAAIARGKSIN